MKHLLSGILKGQHTVAIGSLVDEILADQGAEVALRLMPITPVFASIIEHEVVSGMGGLTEERTLNTEGTEIAGLSTDSKIFKPGYYQEHIKFNERELLNLRKAGTYGERGVTGMTNMELDLVSRAGQKLRLRIKNRIQKLIWDAIFTGKFEYMGTTYDFKIPAQNTLAAETDWTVKASATPYSDLLNQLEKNPILRKYKFKEIVMNGTTSANMLQANSTRSFINNANITDLSPEAVKSFVAPGLPEMTVVKDSYQTESVEDGKVKTGNAQFFVPDNKILLVPDFGNAEYGQYGEFEMTENLNAPEATLDKPATGPYVFTDEKGLEKKANPNVKVYGGFNGAPNLKRVNDVFVLTVS